MSLTDAGLFLDQGEVPTRKLLLQHFVGFHSFRKVDRDGAKLGVRHGQSGSKCRGRQSVVLQVVCQEAVFTRGLSLPEGRVYQGAESTKELSLVRIEQNSLENDDSTPSGSFDQ